MHTHELPVGWHIVCAANPPTDEFFVTDMDRALMNRFCHVKYDVDYKAWTHYAKNKGLETNLIDFVNTYKVFDKRKDVEYNLNIVPTPRGFDMAFKLMAHLPSDSTQSFKREALMGLVGLEPANMLLNHLDGKTSERITISEILGFNDKVKAKVDKLVGEGRLDVMDNSLRSSIEYMVTNKSTMKPAQIKCFFEYLKACPKDMVKQIALTNEFTELVDNEKVMKNGGEEFLLEFQKSLDAEEVKK